jgi:hypothetical protein
MEGQPLNNLKTLHSETKVISRCLRILCCELDLFLVNRLVGIEEQGNPKAEQKGHETTIAKGLQEEVIACSEYQ